ncbi:MAG: SPFH domain-containing protein [Patescibacteria group bacterium]
MEWLITLGISLAFFFWFIRCFTTVNEGTAKAVVSFGKFKKILFSWEKHWMDHSWKILTDEEDPDRRERDEVWTGLRIVGGLYLYGIWPFHAIHQYKNRWTDIRLRESGDTNPEFHEELRMRHVLLKSAVYAIKLTAVETAPPERIPVDVLVLITLRIDNPYSFLFIAPPTPIEDVLAKIKAEMRSIVTSRDLDTLLKLKGASLWAENQEGLLTGAKVIEETLQKWGMKLADKGIEIQEVDLSEDYQRAASAKRKQELIAAGRAEEIMGTVIASVASAGKSPEQVKKELQASPEEFYRRHKVIIDSTMSKLSMESKSYLRIETPGAEGGDGGVLAGILKIIAAYKGMPPVGEGVTPEQKSSEAAEKKDESSGGGASSQEHLEDQVPPVRKVKSRYPAIIPNPEEDVSLGKKALGLLAIFSMVGSMIYWLIR